MPRTLIETARKAITVAKIRASVGDNVGAIEKLEDAEDALATLDMYADNTVILPAEVRMAMEEIDTEVEEVIALTLDVPPVPEA